MKLIDKIGNIQIAMSLYDVIGYFLPGITLFVSALAFDSLLHETSMNISANLRTPVFSVFNRSIQHVDNNHYALSALFLISYISACYVTGHIISTCSSFFGEKIMIAKAHRYPFERFLNIKYGAYTDISSLFFKGAFFWLNSYLLIRYFHIIKNNPYCEVLSDYLSYLLIFFIVLKLVLSIPVPFPNGKKLEELYQEKLEKFHQEISNERNQTIQKKKKILLRIALYPKHLFYVFAIPYNLIGYYLASLFRTRNVFSPWMVRRFKKGYRNLFGHGVENSKSDSFWLPNCFVRCNSSILTSQLNVFFHNYSYARNISASLYSAFIYCISILLLNRKHIWAINDYKILYLPIIYLLLSLIMFYRYYYIYICYFSKFLFRSFVFLTVGEYESLSLGKRVPPPPPTSTAAGVEHKIRRNQTETQQNFQGAETVEIENEGIEGRKQDISPMAEEL